jgi:uncharacterized protein (DUF58 family)
VRGRALLRIVLCVAALAAAFSAAAYATTVTGTQNPQFRVRVTITPAHPHVGQTVVATFRITNLTARTHRGEWEFTWSTPSSGIGSALAGPLRPGRIASETLRQKVTARTPKGSYVISASVSDARGRSHASAKAVFGG